MTPPQVDRDLLRVLLSIFFRAPVCGMGGAAIMPLTILGLLGTKLYVRRRPGGVRVSGRPVAVEALGIDRHREASAGSPR